jgi:hypothetical protein
VTLCDPEYATRLFHLCVTVLHVKRLVREERRDAQSLEEVYTLFPVLEERGRITLSGESAEFQRNPQMERVYFGI